jgi:hypothetical protein
MNTFIRPQATRIKKKRKRKTHYKLQARVTNITVDQQKIAGKHIVSPESG